jgi:hypothetical protein
LPARKQKRQFDDFLVHTGRFGRHSIEQRLHGVTCRGVRVRCSTSHGQGRVSSYSAAEQMPSTLCAGMYSLLRSVARSDKERILGFRLDAGAEPQRFRTCFPGTYYALQQGCHTEFVWTSLRELSISSRFTLRFSGWVHTRVRAVPTFVARRVSDRAEVSGSSLSFEKSSGEWHQITAGSQVWWVVWTDNSDSNDSETEGIGVNAAGSDGSADHAGNCGKDIALRSRTGTITGNISKSSTAPQIDLRS